jgi:hypothetical protein
VLDTKSPKHLEMAQGHISLSNNAKGGEIKAKANGSANTCEF